MSLEDGSRRRFWRDPLGRVVVPWPVMPWTACEPGPALATALGQPPEQWLVASFGYVAVFRTRRPCVAWHLTCWPSRPSTETP